jgi:hypothetical protein
MSSKHSFFVAAACAVPLSLAACGSSDDNSPTVPVPEGPHYGYVVSSASVPVTDKQVTDFGLDLGSMKSSKLDGSVDNKLGVLLSSLSSSVDIQGAITKAIDMGSIMLLIDFQTQDLANSTAAGFSVEIGATSTPPACTDASDMTCRHHLDGHGVFTVAAGSPDTLVAGKIVATAFTGGPGDVTLQIALGGATPITLHLLRARVQATISPTGIMNAKVGGVITQSDLTTQIGPAIQTQVATLLTQSCTPGAPPPGCGCTGTAAFLILFDTNGDCQLSTDEILNAQAIKAETGPDVCTTDACTTPDGLSIGVEVQAVKAMFPGVTM